MVGGVRCFYVVVVIDVFVDGDRGGVGAVC